MFFRAGDRESTVHTTLLTTGQRVGLGRQSITGLWLCICLIGIIFTSAGPVFAQGFMVSPMLIEIPLAPGETYTGIVEIRNTSEETIQVRISNADFTVRENGTLEVLEAGTSSSSLANWLSLSTEELTVKAQETERVSLSIARPQDDAPLPHWGCLIVERVEPDVAVGAEEAVIGIKFRFLVTILQRDLTITQKLGNVAAMEVKVKEPDEESPRTVTVSARFANTCLDILDVNVHFEVRDMTGTAIASEEIENRKVLPEHKRVFTAGFSAEEWPPGQYIALAIIDYGGDTLTGGQWGFAIP